MPAFSVNSEVADRTDRRTLRSRQVLMDALGRILKKRDFDDISIQEISDEADLTRATFYLHYPDKASLLQAMTDACFGRLLQKRAITFPCRAGGIKAIALSVCEYLAKASRRPSGLSKMPLERSVIPALEGIFLNGVKELRLAPGVDPQIFATAIAWAIYGTATRWAQTSNRMPAAQMAEVIEVLMQPFLQSMKSA